MFKYNYSKIGERFRSERKKLGISQQELIDRIREKEKPTVGRNILSRLENGDETAFNGISIAQLTAICEEFDCSISYLLGEYEAHTYDLEFIHAQTGLAEDAINSLIGLNNLNEMSPACQNDKFDLINLILQDTHKKESFSSLLDLIVGFCRFTIPAASDSLYTVDSNGITKFQGHPSLSGKGMSYNPLQAHFHMQDMESMYYLKIWDAIRELKEMYTVYQNPEKN